MSLPPEILKKVKLLELSTRKMVNSVFAGEYHSAFKGQGMTFSEFREYVPGDDVRSISWPLTARTGKPYIKIFDEERESSLILAVDVSGSSDFGTSKYFKGEAMAHIAALLGFSAERNHDPVGLLLFSDQVEHFVPPKKGRGQVHRILRDLYYFKPRSRYTDISSALDYLQGVLKKRSHVFVISDFLDQGYDMSLKLMGRRHDTVAVVVRDQAEGTLPVMGLMDFQDPETGEIFTVDTSSKKFQNEYKNSMDIQKEARDQELRRAQIDRIDIGTGSDFTDPLIAFFRRRNRR